MTIEVTKNVVSEGVAIVDITGIASVGTSTTGTQEDLSLDDVGIVGGELVGIGVFCDSTDFDWVIGDASAVLGFSLSKGYALVIAQRVTVNLGSSHSSLLPYFHAGLGILVKNDDSANATGLISVRLHLKY